MIGGSGTNEGGIGVGSALGYEFVDKNEKEIKPIGENLIRIKDIRQKNLELDDLIKNSKIKVFTDVTNPFTG